MRVEHQENSLEIAKHITSISTQNLQYGAVKVLFTGFRCRDVGTARTRDHTISPNIEWKAIEKIIRDKLIPNPFPEAGRAIVGDAYEVPDVYGHLAVQIPKYWQKHQPHLAVHVESSDDVSTFVLQEGAHCCGYTLLDRTEHLPARHELNCHDLPEETHIESALLQTTLDLKSVAETVNKANTGGITAEVRHSYERRSIGEFAYSKSLKWSADRSVFIIVPTNFQHDPVSTIAYGINLCVDELLRQMKHKNLLD